MTLTWPDLSTSGLIVTLFNSKPPSWSSSSFSHPCRRRGRSIRDGDISDDDDNGDSFDGVESDNGEGEFGLERERCRHGCIVTERVSGLAALWVGVCAGQAHVRRGQLTDGSRGDSPEGSSPNTLKLGGQGPLRDLCFVGARLE